MEDCEGEGEEGIKEKDRYHILCGMGSGSGKERGGMVRI